MKLWTKFRMLLARRRLEREMAAEMQAHLDGLAERNVARGMTPEEARYAARREFGGVEQIKERARDERALMWVEQVAQDVRYGCRSLRQRPGFTAIAVLSLALGIGATTAIFSVVNEVLLKPLPVARAEELVRFSWEGSIEKIAGSYSDALPDGRGGHVGANFTILTYRRFQENNQTLQSLFASGTFWGHTVIIGGEAEAIGGADYVSGQYFTGLGVKAACGRTLTEADDRAGAPLVAMISYAYWQRRFGGNPAVAGQSILVNLQPVTIVGVTPPEFHGIDPADNARNLFLPLAQLDHVTPGAASVATKPGVRWTFGVMGRLKPGVTVAQAEANFAPVFQQGALDGARQNGGGNQTLDDVRGAIPQLILQRGSNGSEMVRREGAQKLTVLIGLMGLMLLIACVNVASLLLARGAARRREIAVRLALGAGRARLVRQLLVESLLLAAVGGLGGVIVACWGGDLLAAMFGFGGVQHTAPDWRVFGFAAVVSTVSGVVFGLIPALRATRVDLMAEFQGGSRTFGIRPALRLGKVLMAVQVALSFVVLAGAGLFITTVGKLRSADLGFARDHLLLFRLAAAPAGYKGEAIAPLFERVAAAIRTLPGVESATFGNRPAVSGWNDWYGVRVEGHPVSAHPLAAAVNEVDGSFFPAYRMPAIVGRTLESRDGPHAPRVVVINQAAVAEFFSGENPVGRHLRYNSVDVEIVGVVRDILYANVRQGRPPTIYAPYAQLPAEGADFAVRTTGDPLALADTLRKVVHGIDPHIPVTNLRTQEEQLESLFRDERMFGDLCSIFGGLALLLVCVGLYGLMSYAVQRRTGEIGVRVALGALPGQVLRMILRESFVLVALGTVAGIAAACASTRIIASMLYGTSPTNPLILGAVALVLSAVALLACWLPARRAAKVDPMVALRAE